MMLTRVVIPILIVFSLSGFTGLSKEVTPPIEDIKGNPDRDVGIVFSLEDMATDIMQASSDDISFRAAITPNKPIYSLSTPIDFKPKKITFANEKLGFTAQVFRPTFRFAFDSGKFRSIYFYPFDPSKWRTQEETQPYLDEWLKKLDDAGWKRVFPEKEDSWWWQPLKYPKKESLYKNNYMVWESPHTEYPYQIVMLVKMADPVSYGKKFSERRYNITLRIERIFTK